MIASPTNSYEDHNACGLTRAEQHEVKRHRERMCAQCQRDIPLTEATHDWLKNHALEWRQNRQRVYLEKQREEILRHKWIESEKAQRDLGSKAVLDWISNYAAQWRESF